MSTPYTASDILDRYNSWTDEEFKNFIMKLTCAECPFNEICDIPNLDCYNFVIDQIMALSNTNKKENTMKKENIDKKENIVKDNTTITKILLTCSNGGNALLTLTKEQCKVIEWLYENGWLDDDVYYDYLDEVINEEINLTE